MPERELGELLSDRWRPWHPPTELPDLVVWSVDDGRFEEELRELEPLVGELRRVEEESLHELVGGQPMPMVVLTESRDQVTERVAVELERHEVRWVPIARFYERVLGKLSRAEAAAFQAWKHQPDWSTRLASAVINRVVAAVALLVASPLAVLVGLAVWLEDRGTIFFKQARLGKDGARLTLVKFRTMSPPDEENPEDGDPEEKPWHLTYWPSEEDRLTRTGRVLRASKLDEVPQLINVARGHMNLVGPRAEQPRAFAARKQLVPNYAARAAVTPGLAPWGFDRIYQTATEKLQYDLYYVKHRSLAFDIAIMARTLRAIFRKVKKPAPRRSRPLSKHMKQ